MKKLYMGIIGLAFILPATAQVSRTISSSTPVNVSIPSGGANLVLSPTDTLWGWYTSGSATPTLIGATGGGYVSGPNGYGDKEKVEKFIVTTPYSVEGCVFVVPVIDGSAQGVDYFTTQMYNIDGTAASVNNGTTYPGPGTIISGSNVDVLVNSIDTLSTGAAGMTYVTLSAPIAVTADYGYGADFNPLYSNPGLFVGLVSSTSGDGGGLEMCYEKWSDDTWHTIMEGWTNQPDIDLAIFPIVNMVTGIENTSFVHGISLSKPSPNPVVGTSVLHYALQKNVSDLSIVIMDMSGKKISEDKLQNVNAGEHAFNINAATFVNGTYFVVVDADGKKLASKFQVSK